MARRLLVRAKGHRADKSQLCFYRDLLVTVREKVATTKKEGKWRQRQHRARSLSFRCPITNP
jgi:hypothetical protein